MKLKYKFFAVDFDNTIAYENYPFIGDLIPGAKETIQKIHELGGKIAIWTCRTGEQEEWVKEFLAKHDIPYDKFNTCFDEHKELYGGASRKIFADVYIDDRCLLWAGEVVNWDTVEVLILEEVN